jgi:predicted peptidase
MPAGRLFARTLCLKGIHAFLIHLPHYGARRSKEFRRDGSQVLKTMQQAIADVRRARDAIVVLPNIDTRHIGIQGTSLGGFVAATSASLDRCFTTVFIVLAGGDLYGMILNGKKDTAKVRQLLAEAGYTDDKLKSLVSPIEPTRLAHRLDPEQTWLYSAEQDTVVPIENAIILAKSAKLDKQHHIKLIGNHYSVIVHFPMIVGHMVKQIHEAAESSR